MIHGTRPRRWRAMSISSSLKQARKLGRHDERFDSEIQATTLVEGGEARRWLG